jgi:hypothetical protein
MFNIQPFFRNEDPDIEDETQRTEAEQENNG